MSAKTFDNVVEAHGIMGSLAWVIFFPLAGIIIRIVPGSKTWLIHAGIALFGLALFTSNFGMGVWIVQSPLGEFPFTENAHPLVGAILFTLVWTQPISGVLHHTLFKKYDKRTIASFMHITIGRIAIFLGILNGGLGLMLGGDGTRGENIAYGVIAAIIWVTYMAVSFLGESKREDSIKGHWKPSESKA